MKGDGAPLDFRGRLALGGLLLLHIAVNAFWLSTNVTITGWDVPGHLVSSYAYHQLLQAWGPQTPYRIITLDSYRPPLFHLSPLPLFWLWGRSADVATLINLAYMAILIGSVYGVGRRLVSPQVGLLAAFLVAMYPMLFAMTRLFYVDYALTALVALSIYFLVRSEGLAHRRWSLALGLSLGLGALIKWTHPLFVLPPMAIAWASHRGMPSPSPGRPSPLRMVISALLALAVVLLWYLPNLQEVQSSILGLWILPISWALFASTMALVPSSRSANGILAILVGISVASLWYLPQIGFLRTLLLVGYGKPWEAVWGFEYYFRVLVNEQLSPLFFLALLGGLGALLAGIRKLSRAQRASLGILGTWFLIPMLALSWKTTTIDSRYTMPLLPPLALLTAWGLLSLKWPWPRRAIIAFLAIAGLAQFAALSFDPLAWLSRQVKVKVPLLVEVGPLARGRHLMWPNSGETDHRYWVLPSLLEKLEADRKELGLEETSLGFLVNSPQLNDSILYYLLAEGQPAGKYKGLQVFSLARRDLLETGDAEPSTYQELFRMDYVILKKGSRWGLRPSAIQAMDRLDDPKDPFYSAFEPLQESRLPDGDRVFLFGKRRGQNP